MSALLIHYGFIKSFIFQHCNFVSIFMPLCHRITGCNAVVTPSLVKIIGAVAMG